MLNTKEAKFEKMMGENINGWMWSFHSALEYVADLVIDGKVTLSNDSDFESLAKPFDTENHNGEDIYGLFHLFTEMSASTIDLDTLGIDEGDLWEIDMDENDIIKMFDNDPKKVAQFLKSAQANFIAKVGA
jgi:hypothetical protein